MGQLLFEKESYKIRGAAFQVYNTMGCGFLEAVYQECLERELLIRNIPFAAGVILNLEYDGYLLEQKYVCDLICYNEIIVEIKAVKSLEDIHRAQVMNYLKATGLKLGLLVNFGSYPKVTIERIIWEKK
ncbi:MAG: GxxExxY protein [Candidatus Cloacimonetes bacterium]|nr:GxxExxY protein [Candidatus Cloacimonadota bacterium]